MDSISPDALAQSARYSRVAVVLHWAIALLLIFNLVLGLVMDPFKGPERYYIMTVHQSAGITVLLLTVARVIWRLMHPPPPYPLGMSRWEHHTAAFVHFGLYAAMILMPLTGWLMISANPPPGSAGARALQEQITGRFGMRGFEQTTATRSPPPAVGARPVAQAPAPAAPPAGAPKRLRPKPKPIKFWFVTPLKPIAVVEQLGESREGFRSQDVLHDALLDWHKIGGWLTIALVVLHVLGALKHQFMDRQPSFRRMWVGRTE